jgi:hypothetical protein
MEISHKTQTFINHYKVDPETQRVYADSDHDGKYKPEEEVFLTGNNPKNSFDVRPVNASELKAQLAAAGGQIDLKQQSELKLGTAALDTTEKKPTVDKDGTIEVPNSPIALSVLNEFSGSTSDTNILGIHHQVSHTPTSLLLKEDKDGGFEVESHWNVVGSLGFKGLQAPH